jgi:hypothetical protein
MVSDHDSLRLIVVDRSNSVHVAWWSAIWRGQGFESWTDARGWLWDEYRAEVYKNKSGFEIRFRYLEEVTLFKLTWL